MLHSTMYTEGVAIADGSVKNDPEAVVSLQKAVRGFVEGLSKAKLKVDLALDKAKADEKLAWAVLKLEDRI